MIPHIPHIQLKLPFIHPQINEPKLPLFPEQLTKPFKPTIKEILEQYLKNSDPGDHVKMFQKVLDCGTGKLGYHINVCDHCAETKIIPNSCSSSLCPDCQKELAEHWIESRISELLPVPYYQAVFSLPDSLSVFTMYNKKIIFDIFFSAVAAAMNKIPGEKNIEIGFIIVLQTWASSLWFDPHMHVCIPGIGILKNGKLNHYPSKESLPFNEDILSKEFKKVFLEELDAHYFKKNVDENEIISWPDEMKSAGEDETSFKKWISELEQQEWDVNLGKRTYKDPEHLISYIGKRLAISDDQIIGVNSGRVLFEDTKGKKVSLTIEDFVKRLAKHAMPGRYHRIRNYGFLSNGKKTESISRIREELGKALPVIDSETPSSGCTICKKGRMLNVGLILDGGAIKVCEKNIDRLRNKPAWLDQLKEAQNLNDLLPPLRIYLLSKMIEYQ